MTSYVVFLLGIGFGFLLSIPMVLAGVRRFVLRDHEAAMLNGYEGELEQAGSVLNLTMHLGYARRVKVLLDAPTAHDLSSHLLRAAGEILKKRRDQPPDPALLDDDDDDDDGDGFGLAGAES